MNKNVFIPVTGLILAFQYSYDIFFSDGGYTVIIFVPSVSFYFIHIRIPGVAMFRDKVCVLARSVERHRSAVLRHPGGNAVFCFAQHVVNLIRCGSQACGLYIIAGFYNDTCL